MIKSYSVFLSVALVICLGLMAACERSGSPSPKSADGSSAETQSASIQEKKALAQKQLADKKLTAYADVYNTLVNDEHGLPGAYRIFVKKILKAKSPKNIDFPVVEDLDKTLALLKQSRAEATEGQEKLDAAADELIAAGEKLLAHEEELTSYFRQANKNEKRAKAKMVFPVLQDDYESALMALSKFGAAVLAAKRMIAEGHMETFKSTGDMVRYHTEEIMMFTEELMALFDDPKVPFNRNETFLEGNRIVAKLDNAIKAQRKAVEEAGSKDNAASAYYDAIRDNASGIISDYREVRDRRSQAAFTGMLKKYDKVVQDYNSAQVKA